MTITKLNDLYFPQGNEHGEYYEAYYKAVDSAGRIAYGRTPALAIANLQAAI
jgi:hypothetical protein